MKSLILKWLFGTTSVAALLNPAPVPPQEVVIEVAKPTTTIEKTIIQKADESKITALESKIASLEKRIVDLEARPSVKTEIVKEGPSRALRDEPAFMLLFSRVGTLETQFVKLDELERTTDALKAQTGKLCRWIEGAVVIKSGLAAWDTPWCKEPWW